MLTCTHSIYNVYVCMHVAALYCNIYEGPTAKGVERGMAVAHGKARKFA